MESSQQDQKQPLHSSHPQQQTNFTVSHPSPALSQSSTIYESTPKTPIRHRATFARLASVDDGRYEAIKDVEDDITEATPYNDDKQTHGLGISMGDDIKKPDSSLDNNKGQYSVETHEMWSPRNTAKQSVSSFQSSLQQNTAYTPDTQRLRNRRSFAESLRMVYDDFGPSHACAAHQHFHHGRRYWLSIIILTLAVYSTIFSTIFLILALCGVRYRWIRAEGGIMTPNRAELLTAFFAKTIELSFATVFVSFLGQVLSRRAFMKKQGRGVTLAEMDMRSWVMQPGTMITHFEALRSSVMSFLGVLSLIAAVVAMLYTTASAGLVQPQLRYGPWERRTMQGLVKASFANNAYLGDNCGTPIPSSDIADDDAGNTCLQIQYAAQGFHNYQRYLSDWSTVAKNGNGSTDPAHRPKGFALLYENTTVTAPWIETVNMTANYETYNRVINNVTLAMPHAGVPGAARDAINGILQPEDLNGQGIYNLRASVPSPAVNVLCANMSEAELAPIVYNEWNNKTNKFNATLWPSGEQLAFWGSGFYQNKTVVDDIFGWGEKYQVSPPVFPKLPIEYNTILNASGVYSRPAIYLLGKGVAAGYSLCAIKVFQTPFCSTEYNASTVGATLEATCDWDPNINHTYRGDMRYIRSLPNATQGFATISYDWVQMATEWGNSLSLNAGITDGDASNSRLLTELILTANSLSAGLPSIAEALAVLAGCTLLMSTAPAPYVQFWNYTTHVLEPGQYQWFNASLRAQEYASGGAGDPAHRSFYVVLFAILVINVICLAYFVSQNGLVTDFSEPLNLFSLAVNSPPSDLMAGSCAAGPKGQQYKVGWFVNAMGDHLFMENKIDHDDGFVPPPPVQSQQDTPKSPLRQRFEKMSRRKSWF